MKGDSTSRQRGSLFDPLRRYVDAALSATELPRERAERIVRDLAERGEVRARDLQKAARELAQRSARNRRELVRLVRKEIRRQISALGLATSDDVDRLRERVARLERAGRSDRRTVSSTRKQTRSTKPS